MDAVAQSYVKLVLAVGQHDADYVDAYYGPPEWRTEAEANKRALNDIATEASTLRTQLSEIPAGDAEQARVLPSLNADRKGEE